MQTKKHKLFLIVGSGLFGSVCCDMLYKKFPGSIIDIIDKRDHIGGNIYTKNIEGVNIHVYGPHIFHTNEKWVWEYVNSKTPFNNYIQETLAIDKYNNIYHLPFNMNTFYDIYKASTPKKAKEYINKFRIYNKNPKNLEEFALSEVGPDIYELLIKHYTEKQWGKPCNELSVDIIKRLPLRFEFNNNYFNDKYQGIPLFGYTRLIEELTRNAYNIILNTDFNNNVDYYIKNYDYIIYTGSIDELFNYKLGELEWRSLRFDNTYINKEDTQGCAILNNVSDDVKYTRTIEHCYFDDKQNVNDKIYKTYEYPQKWNKQLEKYYPINNDKTDELYNKYVSLLRETYHNILIGGRLGYYKYFDMDDTIIEAKKLIDNLYETIK